MVVEEGLMNDSGDGFLANGYSNQDCHVIEQAFRVFLFEKQLTLNHFNRLANILTIFNAVLGHKIGNFGVAGVVRLPEKSC